MPGSERARFIAGDADAGRRLDQVLATRVPGLSRRQARVLLDIGGVFVDGRRVKVAGRPVRAGEEIVAHVGGALARADKRVGRAARDADEQRLPPPACVFEDEDLVVVEKPAGLLSAPTPESDRGNVVSLLARRAPGPPQPIFVVHRLDLETSGLLVLAKTDLANRALAERFRVHDIERAYLAVLAGAPPESLARIDRPVGGRRAVTHIAVEERLAGGRATLVRCRLETGRTHQIRIHAEAIGHPVLGDPRYGRSGAGPAPPPVPRPPRMALHAAALGFRHPRTGAPLAFESAWPADLAAWTDGLRALGKPGKPEK
jgi:23S rRNA pseudouridine1911/1915/1917 synthase